LNSNLKISGLPHVVNALLCTSIFSAGNAYTYYGTRSLYGLALEGQAPKFLKKCTKKGVPVYCLLVTICFPFLGFLNVNAGSAKVLTWFINLITGAQIINYIVICITYLCFYRAVKAQGVDRKAMPYCGYFQPYGTWISLVFLTMVLGAYGYGTFLPGNFTIDSLFTYYAMLFLAPILFFGWKFLKRTKMIKAHEADLVWEKAYIDAYEASFAEETKGFWQEILEMLTCGMSSRKKHSEYA
jgi:amino acid transporter